MEPDLADKSSTGKAEAQLRKGVLEYCVMALLGQADRYGVELLEVLGTEGVMATSQGTIYPLLARLRREGLVATTWQESRSGPPRRYYSLTSQGEIALAEFANIWPEFRDAVDRFMAR